MNINIIKQKNEQPVERRKLNPSSFLLSLNILLIIPTLLRLAFSRRSRQIILNRSRGRSEITGKRASYWNPLQCAHMPYHQTGLEYKNDPDYDNPSSGYAILQSEHAIQHIQLAEGAGTLNEAYRNVVAARLVLKSWESILFKLSRKYGQDCPVSIVGNKPNRR